MSSVTSCSLEVLGNDRWKIPRLNYLIIKVRTIFMGTTRAVLSFDRNSRFVDIPLTSSFQETTLSRNADKTTIVVKWNFLKFFPEFPINNVAVAYVRAGLHIDAIRVPDYENPIPEDNESSPRAHNEWVIPKDRWAR